MFENNETETITFIHNLKIEPSRLNNKILEYITSTIDNMLFVKKDYCVLEILSTKILSVQITNGHSECVANLAVTAKCLIPAEGKIFYGTVTNVIPNDKLTVVTVENKIDIIIKGLPRHVVGEKCGVKIIKSVFLARKIVCMGKIEDC